MRYYDYKELYDDGMSYQEVAKHFGVTRQAVFSCLKRGPGLELGRPPVYDTVFPGLNRWIEENHTNIYAMERKSGACLRAALKSGNMNKRAIDAVLRVTGLTYEEAFAQ